MQIYLFHINMCARTSPVATIKFGNSTNSIFAEIRKTLLHIFFWLKNVFSTSHLQLITQTSRRICAVRLSNMWAILIKPFLISTVNASVIHMLVTTTCMSAFSVYTTNKTEKNRLCLRAMGKLDPKKLENCQRRMCFITITFSVTSLLSC